MYRLLIVDDEPIIADGLYSLFSGKEGSHLEVHKAYSAPQALRILDVLRIDVVLSDIKMPGMNGIEMLSQIHTRWPFCHVIFLSGYSDFEYVQTAMELGADSYILKSQGDEAVLDAVQKAMLLLDQEHTDTIWNKQLEEELKNAQPLLCKDFLWKILRGELSDPMQMGQQLLKLGLPLDPRTPVLLVGGRIDRMLPQAGDPADIPLLEKINAVFTRYTLAVVNSASVYWNHRYIMWLVQPLQQAPQSPVKVDVFLSGMMERVQSYCLAGLSAEISLVVDPTSHPWASLQANFEKLRSVLTYQLGTQDEMLLGGIGFFGNALPESVLPQDAAEAAFSSLENAFEYRQKEAFRNALGQLLQLLLFGGQPGQRIVLYHKLCLFFLEHIHAGGREKDFLSTFHGYTLFSLPYEQWEEKLTPQFSAIGDWLFDGAEACHAKRFSQMVYTLHQYIAGHISQDLSVNALAEQVYLNPVYLSRAYKQATGENLSEYVLCRRMDKAKQLLRQPDKKVTEIGIAVGFDSAAHFSRVFKKHVGISPQEFRDSL
ncbi:response regulator [Allofournierella sp.]|uniref:response regulator n=1 Tax=Allofournierella sp. TaxID=1940256 RepID=UPI003AB500DB